jgi:hypothetical protein
MIGSVRLTGWALSVQVGERVADKIVFSVDEVTAAMSGGTATLLLAVTDLTYPMSYRFTKPQCRPLDRHS